VTTINTGWTCNRCGFTNEFKNLICYKCFSAKPEGTRSRLPSYGLMDTGSFENPLKRSVLRIWAVITVLVPLIMFALYEIYKRIH